MIADIAPKVDMMPMGENRKKPVGPPEKIFSRVCVLLHGWLEKGSLLLVPHSFSSMQSLV